MWTASELIGSQIRQARLKAISRNKSFRVRFDCPSAGQFRVLVVTGSRHDRQRDRLAAPPRINLRQRRLRHAEATSPTARLPTLTVNQPRRLFIDRRHSGNDHGHLRRQHVSNTDDVWRRGRLALAPTNNERGFTLIEVLIAMVILTVALVAMAELMAITLRMQMLGRNETAAVRLVQSKIDQLVAVNFTNADRRHVGGSLTADVTNYIDTPTPASSGAGRSRRLPARRECATLTVRVIPDVNDAAPTQAVELTDDHQRSRSHEAHPITERTRLHADRAAGAMVCTIIVLGGAVALTSQIQNGYRRQLEDSAGEQEARYALEWIGRYLRSVGNNPFNVDELERARRQTPRSTASS